MNWKEDESVWESLDCLMKSCERDLLMFLNAMHKHEESLDILGNAVLFGALGKLVVTYNKSRKSFGPEESLVIASQVVTGDRRVQGLMGHAVNQTIDSKIEQMKGDA